MMYQSQKLVIGGSSETSWQPPCPRATGAPQGKFTHRKHDKLLKIMFHYAVQKTGVKLPAVCGCRGK